MKAMNTDTILQEKSNVLIIGSEQDLQKFASFCAKQAISELSAAQPQTQPDEPEKPLTPREAEKFLGKTRQTFYKWRKKGLIKPHILGGRLYYFKSELLAAMK